MSAVRGWCPTAHRPMVSGDGLLVRVRPPMGWLSPMACTGLASMMERYGNGILDITSRGNLQIRGVDQAGHPGLLAELIDLELVPDDPDHDLPLTVTPVPDSEGLTECLVANLLAKAGELPELPAKMGVVIDTGRQNYLGDVSGDFRFERCEGSLILRADGVATGYRVALADAAGALIEMARWFVRTGGASVGRMKRHVAGCPVPEAWQGFRPDPPGPKLGPKPAAGVLGVAFGQMTSADLRELAEVRELYRVHVTPWRSLRLTNKQERPIDIKTAAPGLLENKTFLTDHSDPLAQITACPGAPRCTQASVDTRELAKRIAHLSPGPVHISGCAKGCARQKPSPVTLVGREGRFDLVSNGGAKDAPVHERLTPEDVQVHFAGLNKQAMQEGVTEELKSKATVQ